MANIFNNIGSWAKKNSPTLLFIGGTLGLITTVILTAKEAPEAKEKLDEFHENQAENGEELTKPKQIIADIKCAGPVFVPAIISGVVTLTCYSTCFGITNSRLTNTSAALSMAVKNAQDYKDTAREVLGEKKYKEIEEENLKKHVEQDADNIANARVMSTDANAQLFRDCMTGQYVITTRELLQKGVNEVIRCHKNGQDWYDLTDLHDIWGLERTKAAEVWGMMSDDDFYITLDTCVMTPSGRSAVEISYDPILRERYESLYGIRS